MKITADQVVLLSPLAARAYCIRPKGKPAGLLMNRLAERAGTALAEATT